VRAIPARHSPAGRHDNIGSLQRVPEPRTVVTSGRHRLRAKSSRRLWSTLVGERKPPATSSRQPHARFTLDRFKGHDEPDTGVPARQWARCARAGITGWSGPDVGAHGRLGQGFEPARPDLRWTEASLFVLAAGREVTAPREREMLWAKFENPMLGLYGGHLHLRPDTIRPTLMLGVLHNLLWLVADPRRRRRRLGNAAASTHRTKLRRLLADVRPAETPPMLAASWFAPGAGGCPGPHGDRARVAGQPFERSPRLVWQGPCRTNRPSTR
jgi:hypothetical protein